MTISLENYFAGKPHSVEQELLADDLLERVNALIDEATVEGTFTRNVDPDTGTEISGSKGDAGDGGFRLPTATTGAAMSAHKQARAVDVFDAHDRLDNWLTDEILERHGLYREAPECSPGWCHLSTRAPASQKRTFTP